MAKDYSFIGRGEIFLRVKGTGNAFISAGNVSELTMSFEEDKKELRNFMSAGGGVRNALTTISSATGQMTSHDFSPENLARALRGSVTMDAGGPVTDEVHASVGLPGEFIGFNFAYDPNEPVTIKLANDTALAAGTDYELTTNGIVLTDSTTVDATGIKATYVKPAQSVVEMLTESGLEYELYMNGLNDAQSGKAVQVKLHRLKFSPVSGIGLIGDDFGELPMPFDMLADPGKVGAGVSQYAQIIQVD